MHPRAIAAKYLQVTKTVQLSAARPATNLEACNIRYRELAVLLEKAADVPGILRHGAVPERSDSHAQ